MARAPDVSVVIPTRDRPAYLAQTLRTVLRQRHVGIEVLIIDDGSQDPAATAVAGVDDPRVRVHRNDVSAGVAAARNQGIEAARAPFVALLDDDDLWAPDKLQRQLSALRATGAPWSFGGAVHFLPGPRAWHVGAAPSATETSARLPDDNVVPAGSSNVCVSRAALQSSGGFDPGLRQLADWDMWIKLLRRGAPAVVDGFLVAYRLHPTNMALQGTQGLLDEVEVIEGRSADLRGGRPLDRTSFHYWIASMCWRGGQRAQARRAYLRAVRDGELRAALKVLRTLIPVDDLRGRLLRQPPPAWPEHFEDWLREALAESEAGMDEERASPTGSND